MSNGDDEPDEDAEGEALEPANLEDAIDEVSAALDVDTVDEEALNSALDAAAAAVDLAATEADLDSVDAALDDLDAALEAADLPEPEEEDAEDPREELESRVADTRDAIEEARGPYAEDVIESIEESGSTVADTRWTDQGEGELVEAVATFTDSINEVLDTELSAPENPDEIDDVLDAATATVAEAGLDPDDDADTIASLLEVTDGLAEGVEEAQAWDDLTVREQLHAQGFYDVLDHHKDFPPEWSALKVWEDRGNADMILLALDKFDSDFMEEHCLDALRRLGPEEALDAMLDRAGRRDQPAIEILGKIGSDEALETLLDYTDEDSDDGLRRVTFKALGEIGSAEATQAVADGLAAEADSVRSQAARALGMIGDTRAIDPLADVLEADDSDTVRTSAAWALNQIGTRDALEAVAEYADDRAYIVQAEAEKAADAIGATTV